MPMSPFHRSIKIYPRFQAPLVSMVHYRGNPRSWTIRMFDTSPGPDWTDENRFYFHRIDENRFMFIASMEFFIGPMKIDHQLVLDNTRVIELSSFIQG
jgi:hypothetical protein